MIAAALRHAVTVADSCLAHLTGIARNAARASAWVLLALGAGVAAAQGQPPSEPMLRIEPGMHSAAIWRIATDESGRHAVTLGRDKTARVWDINSGRQLHVLRPPIGDGFAGTLYGLAVSREGIIAIAGNSRFSSGPQNHSIYLFDLGTGRLSARLSGVPGIIAQLAFSADGQWLAAGLASQGLRLWHLRGTPKQWADDTTAAVHGLSWAADGRLIATGSDGKLRLYAPPTDTMANFAAAIEATAPGGKEPTSVAFAPDGTKVAVGYSDSPRVDVIDARSLAIMYTTQGTPTSGERSLLAHVAWSRDGQVLAAAGRLSGRSAMGATLLRRWPDEGRGAPADTPLAQNTTQSIVALPDGAWLVASGMPAWGIVAAGQPWHALGTTPLPSFLGARNAPLLDDAATLVQMPFESQGRAMHHFELRQRRLAAGSLPDLKAPRTEGLPIEDWLNRLQPKLAGKVLVQSNSDTSRALAIDAAATRFALGTDSWLRYFDAAGTELWKQQAPATVRGVNVSTDGRMVVAAYEDGTLRWHRTNDGREVLALFAHADGKRWVLWTPSGYYDASPGAEDLIGWHVNRGLDSAADFFPASRLRERNYRPDIIDRVLDTLDEAKALALANDARGSTTLPTMPPAERALPPTVDLLSSAELQASESKVRVRVRSRTTGDAPVTRWRVRVDGQNVELGADDQDVKSGAEHVFAVTVPPRNSEIQIFAENRHGASSPAVVRVQWNGPVPARVADEARAAQPTLYVLSIGVARYANPNIPPLDLSAKDARDFAAALQRQQGRLYRRVESRVLADAQATRDEIVDGLEWLARQVTQHDVGMVFVAGHGLNDSTLGYVYLPVNADPERLRRTGVAMDEFRKTLSNLAGKALFFFDTCHSGNVLGTRARGAPNDVRGVVSELASAENGVVVFSSSTGRQLSYEDVAWGNGAFTKALVEGIEGRADPGRTGRVTHKMLDVYVSERVKELTRGKQSPVTQAPGGVPDFPVSLSR